MFAWSGSKGICVRVRGACVNVCGVCARACVCGGGVIHANLVSGGFEATLNRLLSSAFFSLNTQNRCPQQNASQKTDVPAFLIDDRQTGLTR